MAIETEKLSPANFLACLEPRASDCHKGSHGAVAIIGGSLGMSGALLLAGRAALLLGSGRVFAAFLDENQPSVDCLYPELMLRPRSELLSPPLLDQLSALAIGPGLGTSSSALATVESAIEVSLPLELDADALNLIASTPAFVKLLLNRHAPTILTPHPAEAARLLGLPTATIQNDRVQSVIELSQRYNAHVVLKGYRSLVTAPVETESKRVVYLNQTGNPGLAAAGMGDVLTGITAAFLAQGRPPADALRAAVFIHGKAADDLVAKGCGPIGLTASEVALAARQVLNNLVSDHLT